MRKAALAFGGRQIIRSYAMFITNLIRVLDEWRRYRAAVRDLAAMDDRGLSDIGLNRSMIRHAARHGFDR